VSAVRTALAVAGACVALAGVVVTAQGSPALADAAARNPARLPHVVALRYNPDGAQLTCTRRQLHWDGLVFGDGGPFMVRCDRDGGRYVWDWVGDVTR
jgi:hypothetical protein